MDVPFGNYLALALHELALDVLQFVVGLALP